MNTHPTGECCITALFLSVSILPIHLPTGAILYIPPVTHWSFFTGKALASTMFVGAPYLWAKLENKTDPVKKRKALSLSIGHHLIGV